MVKIIGGKKYNTDTAEAVGQYDNGLGYGDFKHLMETLYKKRTGEFFLYGQGGPMTQYAEPVGNMRADGEKIIPLTFEEAQKWAEEHMDAEEYEAVFGEVSEDSSTIGVMYSLPVASVNKVKRIATERRVTASRVIADLIDTL